MIHYDLRCSADHAFDGWFRDSASYETQAKRGLLECPVCGTPSVERALMTPSVPKKGKRAIALTAQAEAPTAAPMAVAGERIPDHVRAVLQRLRSEVEKNCDYVGPGFADEARKIHSGESDRRAIYGEASAEEAQALHDDGIEVGQIPWVPRADG